jgi:hypothetical protein
VPDAGAPDALVDGDRTHLGEVLPHNVEGATADDAEIGTLSHPELLDVLIQRHHALFEESRSRPGVRVHQPPDRGHVSGARPADGQLHKQHTLTGRRPATAATGPDIGPRRPYNIPIKRVLHVENDAL